MSQTPVELFCAPASAAVNVNHDELDRAAVLRMFKNR